MLQAQQIFFVIKKNRLGINKNNKYKTKLTKCLEKIIIIETKFVQCHKPKHNITYLKYKSKRLSFKKNAILFK